MQNQNPVSLLPKRLVWMGMEKFGSGANRPDRVAQVEGIVSGHEVTPAQEGDATENQGSSDVKEGSFNFGGKKIEGGRIEGKGNENGDKTKALEGEVGEAKKQLEGERGKTEKIKNMYPKVDVGSVKASVAKRMGFPSQSIKFGGGEGRNLKQEMQARMDRDAQNLKEGKVVDGSATMKQFIEVKAGKRPTPAKIDFDAPGGKGVEASPLGRTQALKGVEGVVRNGQLAGFEKNQNGIYAQNQIEQAPIPRTQEAQPKNLSASGNINGISIDS